MTALQLPPTLQTIRLDAGNTVSVSPLHPPCSKPYILTPNVCPHVDWGWRGKRSRKRASCLSWKLRPTGSFGLSNSNSTNLHASENISLQTCTVRLSAIFPHNTGLKLIQFRKTIYHTVVRIDIIHITLSRYGPKLNSPRNLKKKEVTCRSRCVRNWYETSRTSWIEEK